jgi:hypothetical protein
MGDLHVASPSQARGEPGLDNREMQSGAIGISG